VHNHTAKQEQREENAFQCPGQSAGLLSITETDPADDEQECGMDE